MLMQFWACGVVASRSEIFSEADGSEIVCGSLQRKDKDIEDNISDLSSCRRNYLFTAITPQGICTVRPLTPGKREHNL